MKIFYFRSFSIKHTVHETCNKYENMKNRHFVRLQRVHYTAESSSAALQSQVIKISQKIPPCASYCRIKLRGVHHTTESSSKVCITPRSQTAHRGVKIKILVAKLVLVAHEFFKSCF